VPPDSTGAERSADRRNLLVIALLGLTLAGLYFVAIDLHDPRFALDQQQKVISGIAGSPYRYRVLVPLLLEAATRLFSVAGSIQLAFLEASFVYDWLALSAQLAVLYVLSRQHFSPIQSLVGASFTSGLTVLTLAYFTYQPWSIVEVAFFGMGFVFAARRKWVPLLVTVILASFNRETGVFLPLALLLASVDDIFPLRLSTLRRLATRPDTRRAFGLVVLSTAIFAGLRLVRGSADPVDALEAVIDRNFESNNLIAAGLALVFFLGFGWIFAARGLTRASDFDRRLVRVVPFYVVAFGIWGWWREVRILTSLYPILIPLVLSYCYKQRAVDVQSASRRHVTTAADRPLALVTRIER
jgi:hypothetical protein